MDLNCPRVRKKHGGSDACRSLYAPSRKCSRGQKSATAAAQWAFPLPVRVSECKVRTSAGSDPPALYRKHTGRPPFLAASDRSDDADRQGSPIRSTAVEVFPASLLLRKYSPDGAGRSFDALSGFSAHLPLAAADQPENRLAWGLQQVLFHVFSLFYPKRSLFGSFSESFSARRAARRARPDGVNPSFSANASRLRSKACCLDSNAFTAEI